MTTKEEKKEKSWLNGRLRISSDQYSGNTEAIGYHGDGRFRFRYPMLDGKFHGICRCWADNGQLISEEFYGDGKLHGDRKEWYETGALKSHLIHLSGTPCSEKSWYENGQLECEGAYVNGKLSGWRRAWYPDGLHKSEYEYVDGRPLSGKQWYANGQLACEESFRNGKLHSLQRGWYENGIPKHECQYLDGRPHDVQRTWFAGGQLQTEYHYREGRRHGLCQVWSKDGALRTRRYCLRDVVISRAIELLIIAGKLSAKVIIKIKNATVRRICLEELGYARFLSQVEHKIVDRDGEQELVKISWHPREEILCLVKVKCPSTGAFYTLRVPPEIKTVKAAVAWTFNVTASEYNPVQET